MSNPPTPRPDPLRNLEDDIRRQQESRQERLTRILGILTDEGVAIDSRKRRETIANRLEAEGMLVEDLEMLVAWTYTKKLEDRPSYIYTVLSEKAKWKATVEDVSRFMGKERKRMTAALRKEGMPQSKRFTNVMSLDANIFYAVFHDKRPKEEVARMTGLTVEEVVDVTKHEAEKAGIPPDQLKIVLKLANKHAEEDHPQFGIYPNASEAIGNLVGFLKGRQTPRQEEAEVFGEKGDD